VPSPPITLVVDWDGTVTVRDTLWMLMERFGDRAVFERTEGGLGRALSFRDVMETQMRTITAPLGEAVAFLLAEVEVRNGFAALAQRFRPTILSSSFRETIEPVLAREGAELDVVANGLDARPDGWRIRWHDAAPCPVCGDLCKRRALPDASHPLVYVGDGYSDRCAALAADRVFARRDLADYLAAQDHPFEPFETFDDVAAALA
jgi:2-hydroxy-3-keto-5-methylthiopentenyl-1-phosphate phosphatase